MRGTVAPGARPTTERVRSAIFNILRGEVVQGARVLDLYAGSGSLGIEALSRGASWADFVEHHPGQCGIIEANLAGTGFSQRARIHCSDVVRSLASLPGPYQLVLMDPPYRLEDLRTVLEGLLSAPGLVAEGGMVVVGHSRRLALQPSYGSRSAGRAEGTRAHSEGTLRLMSHRRYGDNVIDFFQCVYDSEKEAPIGDRPLPRDL